MTCLRVLRTGFAVLAAGSVRQKNVRNILLKNGLDACVGLVVWFLFGAGLAGSSSTGNPFIGTDRGNFALSGLDDITSNQNGYDWISFFFSYTFAAAAATIVSGAVAERCKLSAYIIYTIVITGFIYPCVVHWVWDASGFMSSGNPDHILGGVIDFAGSGVVHMTGGIASFVAAKILGPRLGRWENPAEFEGHSTPLQVKNARHARTARTCARCTRRARCMRPVPHSTVSSSYPHPCRSWVPSCSGSAGTASTAARPSCSTETPTPWLASPSPRPSRAQLQAARASCSSGSSPPCSAVPISTT